ncbi:hypothetical protein GGX14DRAFT_384840 [Mycena pura]|uniref:Uncharacterized protein n=1 Tax=Mycena pura TaxID=153505 RepID=A0AAD6YT99_9AGAR|nr:hypothetical protein GGX14DRAFT_384840 [Mycena pura]
MPEHAYNCSSLKITQERSLATAWPGYLYGKSHTNGSSVPHTSQPERLQRLHGCGVHSYPQQSTADFRDASHLLTSCHAALYIYQHIWHVIPNLRSFEYFLHAIETFNVHIPSIAQRVVFGEYSYSRIYIRGSVAQNDDNAELAQELYDDESESENEDESEEKEDGEDDEDYIPRGAGQKRGRSAQGEKHGGRKKQKAKKDKPPAREDEFKDYYAARLCLPRAVHCRCPLSAHVQCKQWAIKTRSRTFDGILHKETTIVTLPVAIVGLKTGSSARRESTDLSARESEKWGGKNMTLVESVSEIPQISSKYVKVYTIPELRQHHSRGQINFHDPESSPLGTPWEFIHNKEIARLLKGTGIEQGVMALIGTNLWPSVQRHTAPFSLEFLFYGDKKAHAIIVKAM